MAQANDDEEKKGDPENQEKGFGFDDALFQALSATNKENANLICSPLSLLSALTVCMCGSNNSTLKEMLQVLYPNGDNEDAQKLTADIMTLCAFYNEEFDGDKDKPTVNITNKLWIKKGFKILDSYIKATGVDAIEPIDCSNAAEAAKTVNRWFAESTKNMITDIVNEQMMANADLLISVFPRLSVLE